MGIGDREVNAYSQLCYWKITNQNHASFPVDKWNLMAQQSRADTPRRLFGTSGVRGIVHKDLTIDLLNDLGQAIASHLPPHSKVAIATDTRVSREIVKTTVVTGLLASGTSVIDLGILPTPALAFVTTDMGMDAGIMVTASHNPPEYNGIKLFNADGIGYSRQQEQEIESICARRSFRTGGAASLQPEPGARQRYFDYIMERLGTDCFSHKFRVVVDPGNGAAAGFARELFSLAGMEVLPINDTPDGSFPGRSPEPREDTLAGTYEFLKRHHAELAICFDGDADRVVFIDQQGFIDFNQATTLVAAQAVKSSGKKRVATTVETGRLIDLALGHLGVEVVRGKVGDVPVAYLAREIDAAIGVEPVGVYIMPEAGFYPNSFLAALTLLKGIRDVAELRGFFTGVPQLFSGQKKVPCPNEAKSTLMQRVTEHAALFGSGSVNNTDGLRLEFEDSWLLVRPSGTEPIIRIIAESPSEATTEGFLEKAFSVIQDLIRE